MNYNIREQLEELQKKYYLAIDEAYQAKKVLGDKIFETMRNDLYERYIIERDQLIEQAKIPDRNIDFETKLKIYELTPHRRGFLWLWKNEARKLKEREANVENRIELDGRTAAVEELEEKIYGEDEQPEEEQPKKPSFFQRLFRRRAAREQLEASIQEADRATPGEVFEQPDNVAAFEADQAQAARGTPAQENGSTQSPETISPPSEPSDGAHGASSSAPQNNVQTQTPGENPGNVAEQPAPAQASEKPKRGRKPKKPVTDTTTEPPAAPPAHGEQQSEQLAGQLNFDDINQ